MAGLGIAIHRQTDARFCGAITGPSMLQSTVKANALLVAVDGDVNDHGNGALIAGCNQVFAEGLLVSNVGDFADADSKHSSGSNDECASSDHEHGSPSATSGSEDVFVGD